MKSKIQDRLRQLQDEHGSLTVQLIIREARKPSSPLHREFEWDAGKAHQLYLADQARYLIRQFYALTQTSTGTFVRTREYQSLPVDNGDKRSRSRAYFHIDKIMADPSLMRSALNEALRELNSFRQKYQHLIELAGVMKEIERVIPERKSKSRKEAIRTAAAADA
jgi:hypothetical protein